MKMVFVRIDEKTFSLIPGRSSSCKNERMLSFIREQETIWCHCLKQHYPIGIEGRANHYLEARSFAEKIIGFAKRHPEYTFWDIFEFEGGEFSYSAKKELFFEHKKKGRTVAEVIIEMKKRSLL